VDSLRRAIDSCLPSTKETLKEMGVINTPRSRKKHATNDTIVNNLRKSMFSLKQDNTKEGRKKYRLFVRSVAGSLAEKCKKKYAVNHQIRKVLDIKLGFWTSATLLRDEESDLLKTSKDDFDIAIRSDGLSEEVKKSVAAFYREEATVLPGRKTVTANNVQKLVLCKTTEQLHNEFVQGKRTEMSISTFRKLRSKECSSILS
jgi:hypothetical protein